MPPRYSSGHCKTSPKKKKNPNIKPISEISLLLLIEKLRTFIRTFIFWQWKGYNWSYSLFPFYYLETQNLLTHPFIQCLLIIHLLYFRNSSVLGTRKATVKMTEKELFLVKYPFFFFLDMEDGKKDMKREIHEWFK